MKRYKLMIILSLCLLIISCSADVNLSLCEINIKQNNIDIPCDTGYFDFGNIPLNNSQTITFTIENTGIADLKLMSVDKVQVDGQNANEFELIVNQTDVLISPNSYTEFSVNFSPINLGNNTATISIPNNDRDENPYTFVVVGNGTLPAPEMHVIQDTTDILCSTGTFDFGIVEVNTLSVKTTFTIQNNGNKDLNLTGSPNKISISGVNDNMFIVIQNNVHSPVLSGSSTSFYIRFRPTSPGVKSAKISILNDDSDENPYTFTITGTGISEPDINVKVGNTSIPNNTGKYDLGEAFKDRTGLETIFTIENLGTAALKLKDYPEYIKISGSDSALFSVNVSSTNDIIGVGESTTFILIFSPNDVGLKKAQLSIACDDDDENPYTFEVQGTGVDPEINIKQNTINIPNSTGSFDFGNILVSNSSAEITFTIENLGTGRLDLTGSPIIELSGTDASNFSLNILSTQSSVSANGSTTFKMKFTPLSIELKSATIKIANNDLDEDPYTFTIQGTGISGEAIGWIGGGSQGWKQTSGAQAGDNLYSFYQPYSTFVDAYGNIYVADCYNCRVCKWNSSGTAIGWIGGGYIGWQTSTGTNSTKSLRGFNMPAGVFVDKHGYIYVADSHNHRVSKWDSAGNAIGWIGGGLTGWQTSDGANYSYDFGYFARPSGVFVDDDGYIYVTEYSSSRVSKWDSAGNPLGWIGAGLSGWQTGNGSFPGSDYKSFNQPLGLFVDSVGSIYVSDFSNNRITKWDKNGNAIGWIGGGSNGWKTSNAPTASKDYQSFDSPMDVFVSNSGFIYVADHDNHRVCKWDVSGKAYGWLGDGKNGWQIGNGTSSDNDYQSFYGLRCVFVDSNNVLFVADTLNYRISKWVDKIN